MAAYARRMRQSVFDWFLNMDDDQLKTVDRKVLAKALACLESLLLVGNSSAEIRESVERFELDFALKCLVCPFLDKRIGGINDMKDFCEMAARKEEYKRQGKGALSYISSVVSGVSGGLAGGLPVSDPPPYVTRMWVTTDHLTQWLLQNRVAEILLQADNTHVELVRRSVYVLKLFAQKSVLELRHLDMLWNLACTGRHESEEVSACALRARASRMFSSAALMC
jgi:hypothetical protein